MKMYQTIQVEIDESVVTVVLNRPEVRNAFHPTMIRELTEAFREIGGRKDLAIVRLRGEGKSFCAGADLGYMQSMAQYSFEENKKDAEHLYEMFWALRSCPQPIVGYVHGHVMGGALGLLASCDIAAAAEGTQYCFSEARLGLAPAVISPFVLEKVPAAFARRYFLTAEVFGNTEALDCSLIQYAGANAQEFADRMVETLKANGPEAVRASKALMRGPNTWPEVKEFTTKIISERRVSEEGQEGLRGFLEKREPSWRARK